MKKEKKITIYIKSKQTENGQEDCIDNTEFYAEGSYHEIGESRYITYKESEVSGMEGTTTTIKVTGHQISLIRYGSVSSKLVFEKGKETSTLYRTPYGCFNIIVNTKDIKIDLNDSSESSIYIKYRLDIDGQPTYIHELLVSFK